MTSTTTFGGINSEGRNSSKVLKPPGGGSSDIFGTNGGPSTEVVSTPSRRVKNHQQSNLFLNDEPSFTPSRNQNGKDTHSRLFGTPPSTALSGKNRMKSNIVLNEEDKDNRNEQKDEQKTDMNPECTDGAHNGENGHFEEPAVNGGSVINGNAAPPVLNGNNGNSVPAPAQRQRIPPGGFSSGLW